jgi:polysaccharide pyruvyl transferase WcaK-like protein
MMKHKTSRRKTVVIVNDGLGPNLGDQAILTAMLASLELTFPSANLCVFPNSDMRSMKQYKALCRVLKESQLMIFGGGQLIQDQTSLVFLLSGLIKIILAKIFSKPVICYAIGVGPVKTFLGKLLIRLILNRVNLITVRDDDSKSLLISLKVTSPPCHVTADPSFHLIPADRSTADRMFVKEGLTHESKLSIAVTPRRWFHYGHYLLPSYIRGRILPLKGKNRFEELENIIAGVCDQLVSEYQAQIVFIPMKKAHDRIDPGQDDDRVCEEILARMHSKKNKARILQGD